MKIYAQPGSNEQNIHYTPEPDIPDGYVLMKYERPTPEHVAAADGTWILPPPDQQEKDTNESPEQLTNI